MGSVVWFLSLFFRNFPTKLFHMNKRKNTPFEVGNVVHISIFRLDYSNFLCIFSPFNDLRYAKYFGVWFRWFFSRKIYKYKVDAWYFVIFRLLWARLSIIYMKKYIDWEMIRNGIVTFDRKFASKGQIWIKFLGHILLNFCFIKYLNCYK